jgi:hypothetical protein
MTLDQFQTLQAGLFDAFGWVARWWLILFAVASVAMGTFIFFLQVVSTWLEARS